MSVRELNSVDLLVEESGEGDPLVLVHGSWDDHRIWALATEELAGSFRVVSYDRRGHTRSGNGDGPGTRRDDEDDLAALIESLDAGPVHVVAHSFGASAALGLATRRPELFRTLCAHEPPLFSLLGDDPVVAEVDAGFGAVVALVERGDPEAAAQFFVDNIAVGPGAWDGLSEEERSTLTGNAPTFAEEQSDPAWASIDPAGLKRITFPVLATSGEESPPFLEAIVNRIVDAIDSAEIRRLPGAGHIPHETHPVEYAAAVREFIADH